MNPMMMNNYTYRSSLMGDMPCLIVQSLITLGLLILGIELMQDHGERLFLLAPVPTGLSLTYIVLSRMKRIYQFNSRVVESYGGVFISTKEFILMSRIGHIILEKPFIKGYFGIGDIQLIDMVSGRVLMTLDSVPNAEDAYRQLLIYLGNRTGPSLPKANS